MCAVVRAGRRSMRSQNIGKSRTMYSAVLYNAVQCNTVLCGTVQCIVVQDSSLGVSLLRLWSLRSYPYSGGNRHLVYEFLRSPR